MAKNTKIKKYRRPLNLNIGMLLFLAVFVYVLICVITYFQTTHIVRYEVKEGSLAADTIFKGLILREEEVVPSGASGYINFFAREGEKVSNKDLVYTIDETGHLMESLAEEHIDTNSLNERELAELRNEIVSFMHEYDRASYASVYDFKNTMNNTVLKLANSSMIQNISDVTGSGISVNFYNAVRSGIVSYWTDGFEDLSVEQITKDSFDLDKYEKKQVTSNELIAIGDPAYKLSKSENWSIIIQTDPEFAEELLEEEYVKVIFSKNRYQSWGQVFLHKGLDGNTFVELKFTNSMITFVNDRFIDIELLIHDDTGLKIPNSSVVQKEFFLIPDEFIQNENSNGNESVIRQCYLEDGTVSSEQVITGVYSHDEENHQYYVDASVLSAGDILHKQNGQDTFVVSARATLIGVYNMNKGYADFKKIEILCQNDEYSIVEANTKYGLQVYDYIVLDAKDVTDDQFISNK